MMKRILVSGGFGFIGSHLVEQLLADESVAVHVVDDLSSSPLDLDYYLRSIGHSPRLTFEIAPIARYIAGSPAHFHEVYHLASPVGPAGVLQHGGNMVRLIVDDCYALIDCCSSISARLLDVSTSEVYGGGKEGLCSEDSVKIVPAETTVRLEYAMAKLAAETAIINSSRIRGLSAVIARPFNVAGPRQSPKGGFVLPRFIGQALSGEPLTVFGNGSALRAFTHVADMASGLRAVMAGGSSGEAYNIGNGDNKISISALADKVIALLSSTSPKIFVDPKTIYGPLYEEANDKFPDALKATAHLGWCPTRTIDETIIDAAAEIVAQAEAGVLRDHHYDLRKRARIRQ